MTVTETPIKWPKPAVDLPAETPRDVALKSLSYLERIHWWVRLFGIVWIVIPFLVAAAGVAFIIGGISLTAADAPTHSSAEYTRCLGTFKASTCARMYPG